MQIGIVARVAEILCESENTIALVSFLGVVILEIKLMKTVSKIGQMHKSPKVENSDNKSEILPKPSGLKNSIIIVAAPSELRGSGFLNIKLPITIIT